MTAKLLPPRIRRVLTAKVEVAPNSTDKDYEFRPWW